MEPTTELEKAIHTLVTKWQHALGLRDWDLAWTWISREEMKEHYGKDDHTIAITHYNLGARRASIRFRKDEEWHVTEDLFDPNNVEHTIVHELVHIYLAPICHTTDMISDSTESALVKVALRQVEEDLVDSIVELVYSNAKKKEGTV